MSAQTRDQEVEGINVAKNKLIARQLRRFANELEETNAEVEYVILSISRLDEVPSFAGAGDMRRDSAIGILSMGATYLSNGGDLERLD